MGEVILPPGALEIIRALDRRITELTRRGARFPTYTTAALPAATEVQVGATVFVSDAADGQRFKGSDGTSWKTLG